MLTSRQMTTRKLPAAVAMATAACVLSAPLAGIWHEATARHIACLEHGELVDAAPLTRAELAAPEHRHAQTVVEQGDGVPGALEHEAHCLLATWSTERSTPAHDGQHAAQPQLALAQLNSDAPDRRPPAIALYLLAPKLSPPLG